MVLTRAKKESIVGEFTGAIKNATILVFVNFHGLSVAKTTKLRKDLRAAGVGYQVLKKTLLDKGLKSIGVSDVPKLSGEVGVVVSTGDITEAPRIVAKFIKEAKEGLAILGGVYEAKFVGEDMIKRLAAIPSRDTLLTQLAFMLNQPVASLARALNAVGKKLETK